jgi:4,5-DOPA dioxygenase extradiol
MMPKAPCLFVSHGAPTMVIEDSSTRAFLQALGRQFERPRAVLAVTGHWLTPVPMLGGSDRPETIHDFYGFPDELYEIEYPAPGAPDLAEQARGLLAKAGLAVAVDQGAGIDHGVWSPLALIYPEADVPVVPLSVQPGEDAAFHVRIGEALRPLREEGVMILASGGLTHNLREYMVRPEDAPPADWALSFADWVERSVVKGDRAALIDWKRSGPSAARNHPTDDHWLPFMVAVGAAAEGSRAKALHRTISWGVLALDAYQFE